VDLFARVGLKTNAEKMKVMVNLPGAIQTYCTALSMRTSTSWRGREMLTASGNADTSFALSVTRISLKVWWHHTCAASTTWGWLTGSPEGTTCSTRAGLLFVQLTRTTRRPHPMSVASL